MGINDYFGRINGGAGAVPSGDDIGDILVWNGEEWVTKPKWQMTYQPVEYIESDGNQYINTGFIGANGIDIEFQYTDTNYRHQDGSYYAEGNCVFGMASNISGNLFNFKSTYNADAFTLAAGSWTSVTIATKDINKHALRAGSNNSWKVTYDNTEIASINEFATTTYSMFLFASNATGLWDWSKSRIYKAKLYKDNVIVRDFIPVRNIINGSIGLYETVEGKFYGNNGSGTFLKGADINA